MTEFFNTINYSSSNEDAQSELKALGLGKEDTVLSITGSGGRTLDLLIAKPAHIISIDLNPCQNFLLELKMAAIEKLGYDEFLGFLGISGFPERLRLYRDIRLLLSNTARDFWDANGTLIEKGVIYQGRWERYFRRLARMVNMIWPEKTSCLFECRTIQEQSIFWHTHWNSRAWREFIRIISSRSVWKYAFGDPGFYQFVLPDFSIYHYIADRFNHGMTHVLARKSPLMTLLFTGRYKNHECLPPHLMKENFTRLKDLMERIRIVTASLDDFLRQCGASSFNKFSLSDIASYTNPDEYVAIWRSILSSATSEARICERQFLVKREMPPEVNRYLVRDRSLEDDLERTDTSIFYTFVVAEMNGESYGQLQDRSLHSSG